jgi:hypothetical protein
MERKEFYKQLKSFLKELVIVFPEDDEDLQIVTTSLNLAIIDDNNDRIIKKFYGAISCLETQLFNRDIDLFNKISWDNQSYEYSLFVKINTQWSSFSENNKNIIWDYIILLYQFSKKIVTLK